MKRLFAIWIIMLVAATAIKLAVLHFLPAAAMPRLPASHPANVEYLLPLHSAELPLIPLLHAGDSIIVCGSRCMATPVSIVALHKDTSGQQTAWLLLQLSRSSAEAFSSAVADSSRRIFVVRR